MSSIVQKWGKPVAERGFTQVPNYLLLANQFLDEDNKISPMEMAVLIQLLHVWWKPSDVPFPSMRTIAERTGTSERQVARTIKKLEDREFIKRQKRKRQKGMIASNGYDLRPLVVFLFNLSKEFPNAFKRNIQ